MDTCLNKPTNRSTAISEHLLSYFDCAKNYRDSNFSIISKARSEYQFDVLESVDKNA